MNGKYDMYAILRHAALLVLACGTLASCVRDEEFDDAVPLDRNALLASGRYLTARDATRIGAGDAASWFDVGTRYRLLAYVKAYDATNPTDQTPAEVLRFDLEAWEDEVAPGGLRFIHIDDGSDTPDRLFGFQALQNEPPHGTDGLVSLDFYGFTYGVPVSADAPATDYISLTSKNSSMLYDQLVRQESIGDGEGPDADGVYTGALKDLMWGRLLNQNIVTAGNRSAEYNASELPPAKAAQSVLAFTHCFSRLDIQVVQEGKETTDATGNPVTEPIYPNLYVDDIRITNTYREGNIYMKDGLVELQGDPVKRRLQLVDNADKPVDAVQVKAEAQEVGRMFIFPSDAESSLTQATSYKVGMEIDVRCDNRTTLTQFLVNTATAADAAAAAGMISVVKENDGPEWYKATIRKAQIVNNYDSNNGPIYFKRNTIYQLQVTFLENTVRIITVIPLVMEWLPGEGAAEDPWQDQPMGQPQMFDNVVWSDRNLGADHFDPEGADFEKTVGYFYQAGRNIPYFPFDTRLWYDTFAGELHGEGPAWSDNERNNYAAAIASGLTDAKKEEFWARWQKAEMSKTPTPADKQKSVLADVQGYDKTTYRFYPMVDPSLINMMNQKSGFGLAGGIRGYNRTDAGHDVNDWTWAIGSDEKTIIAIPETNPKNEQGKENSYFDFKKDELRDYDNMHWDLGQQNQPVKGSWVVPTSQQFLTIFPSTPHAGNLAFRKGGNNSQPTEGWGNGEGMEDGVKVLRVTVPYYTVGMAEPTGRSGKYMEAWTTLKNNNDAGTTNLDKYPDWGPNNQTNIGCEPDGDPEDGYASIYLISRDGDDEVRIDSGPNAPASTSLSTYVIQSWGTIYAIKRAYTSEAYRLRWRVLVAGYFGANKDKPGLYVEICRYRCDADDTLTKENYKGYDWNHPAARLYFPITGLGDFTAVYINFGTECQYATSDPITGGKTSALQIKITGSERSNVYMAVVKGKINAAFGMQIRPVGGGNSSK